MSKISDDNDKLSPVTKLAEMQRLLDSGKLSRDEEVTICWCIGALQYVFGVSHTDVVNALKAQWGGVI